MADAILSVEQRRALLDEARNSPLTEAMAAIPDIPEMLDGLVESVRREGKIPTAMAILDAGLKLTTPECAAMIAVLFERRRGAPSSSPK